MTDVCCSLEIVTPSPSSPVRFYTKPQGVYTVLAGDQFYLNCTAGGRYGTFVMLILRFSESAGVQNRNDITELKISDRDVDERFIQMVLTLGGQGV